MHCPASWVPCIDANWTVGLGHLVTERPEGRNVFYRAEPNGLAPLVDWMRHYGVFWRERVDTLRSLLKEIDP